MGTYENLLNGALWITGSLLALASIVWFGWALFSDRARARRRCPACWYDFATLAATAPCPECGRVPRSERHLTRTRRRPFHATLATVFLVFGYALWALPRVFEERSETGLIPTTFLILAAPTLDAQAIADASNLRGLALARLERGEIKQPWRWLWRQRVKLAHVVTGTPYLEVAWSDVKAIYPPWKPQPRVNYESPIQLDGPDPEPTIEAFGESLMSLSVLSTHDATPPTIGIGVAIGEHWIAAGPARGIDRAWRIVDMLRRSGSEVSRASNAHRWRIDERDISEDMAILARLDSSLVPAWAGSITLPQLAEKLSLVANCPVDLDLEPNALTEHESRIEAIAHPNTTVRVALGTLCASAETSITTWTVRDGRIIIQRRPTRAHEYVWVPPDFIEPSLVLFDVSDLIADGSGVLGPHSLASRNQEQLVDTIAWHIDRDRWIPNDGIYTLGVVGNFMVVEGDPPTLHMIDLLLDLIRQSQLGLGTDRQRVATWGELPNNDQSLCGADATLSGTRSNPQVVSYNLDLIFGEALSDPHASDPAALRYSDRYDSLHAKGGLIDRLWRLEEEICPDSATHALVPAFTNSRILIVIAPAPAQARVAKLLRESEAERLAQPDITTPRTGDAPTPP